MITINDIKEKYKRVPLPKEVKDIRRKIINSFKNLEFIADGHKYFVLNKDGTKDERISVSKFIEQFTPKVDWDEIAQRKALKDGIPVEELKKQWTYTNKLSTVSGSINHEYGEAFCHFISDDIDSIQDIMKPQYEEGFLIPCNGKQEAMAACYEELFASDDLFPIMPEARIYTEEYCGTFDLCYYYKHPTDDSKSGILLLDWKTNKSLTNDFNMNRGVYMLEPFDHIIDQALGHYTVQLNLYQRALEKIGLKIIARKLLWVKDDGTYEKVPIPYLGEELKQLFND